MKRKIIAVMLVLVLCIVLGGCNNQQPQEEVSSSGKILLIEEGEKEEYSEAIKNNNQNLRENFDIYQKVAIEEGTKILRENLMQIGVEKEYINEYLSDYEENLYRNTEEMKEAIEGHIKSDNKNKKIIIKTYMSDDKVTIIQK